LRVLPAHFILTIEYIAVAYIVRILALLTLSLGFVTCASAATQVYWRPSDTNNDYARPTAQSACDHFASSSYTAPTAYYKSASVTYASATEASCKVLIGMGYSPEGQEYTATVNAGWIIRFGDTCPGGAPIGAQQECPEVEVYEPGEKCDDQTGGTPSDPMIFDDTVGKCVRFTESEGDAPCTFLKSAGDGNPSYTGTAYSVAGTVNAGGVASAPPTFAQDGLRCEVSTVSTTDCKTSVSGDVTCNVIGKFTGKASSTGALDVSDHLCPNGTCPAQEPETKATEQPCNPVGNGAGGSTCTQVKETVQDGSQQCGTMNGSIKCVTKPPYSNGITTAISATSETLPDGSVKVTTVKNSTNTVCTDIKTCTTSTSTTTSHTVTKPNGTTTTETSCKGVCTPNGGGLETNPTSGSGNNGSGTGGGGTGGNGEGEGGDGTADVAADCAAVPPCDGDVFLCAILKQDHIDTCKLMADATAEQKAAARAKTDAAYADLDALQLEMDNKANGLLAKFQSETSGSAPGGKCLPDLVIPVPGITSLNLEFSKTCDSLSWVRLVVLAGAYLFAARVVFKEI